MKRQPQPPVNGSVLGIPNRFDAKSTKYNQFYAIVIDFMLTAADVIDFMHKLQLKKK